MIELAIKLTLAHVLGDFVFQSDKAVKNIRKRRFQSPYLYTHFATHLLLLLIVTGFQKNYLVPVLLLAIVHIIIDAAFKFLVENDKNRIICFWADQALHVLSLAAFVHYFHPFRIQWNVIFSPENLLLLTAVVTVTMVASVLMKVMLGPLARRDSIKVGTQNAGKLIGMLERLFIFAFVLKNFWEGIGFLLAAKSIFRFGDLKESKDIKLTEYILIGTLLSFGLGIAIGEIYLFFSSKVLNLNSFLG